MMATCETYEQITTGKNLFDKFGHKGKQERERERERERRERENLFDKFVLAHKGKHPFHPITPVRYSPARELKEANVVNVLEVSIHVSSIAHFHMKTCTLVTTTKTYDG